MGCDGREKNKSKQAYIGSRGALEAETNVEDDHLDSSKIPRIPADRIRVTAGHP